MVSEDHVPEPVQPVNAASSTGIHDAGQDLEAADAARQEETSNRSPETSSADHDPAVTLQELRGHLSVVTQRLAASVLADTRSSRPSQSSTTRSLRAEATSLTESIAIIDSALTALAAPRQRPSAQSALPASALVMNPDSPQSETRPLVPYQRPISLPSSLPRFQRTSQAIGVRDFIIAFEDRLRAHAYPTQRYVDALLTCCSKDEADWVRAELRNLTWEQAKERFLSHFASADMIEHAREQLETISRRHGEGLLTFADRYVQAMRLADVNPDSADRVTHLMLRLPADVRRQLKCFKLTAPDSVRTVLTIVETLSAVYSNDRTTPTLTPVISSKWCPTHRSDRHDASECRSSKISASPATKSPTFCNFHKSSGHSTKDCRARNQQAPDAASHIKPLVANSAQPPLQGQRCFKCNKSGHYANNCRSAVNSSSNPTPTLRSDRVNTTHHIQFSANDDSVASSSSSDSASSALATPEDVLHMFSTAPTLHAVNTELGGLNSAILCPIRLADSESTLAYLDTGASHSVIRASLLESLPEGVRSTFKPAPPNSSVSLGAKNAFTTRLGSIQVSFAWDSRRFSHRFELLDTPDGIDVIIGRDLLSILGITISGLPLPTAASQESTPEDVRERTTDANSPTAESVPLHPRVQAAIERNQSVPRNSFCTLPQSVVYLHTGAAHPVYRRQYNIAHSVEPIVDAQLSEWLSDGKITPAPRDCQWNHPILVVPKKTADGSKAPGRVCIDPRALNQLIQAERCPMPRVRDIFNALAGRFLFTSMDLEQSFLQLKIYEKHQSKVAFSWKGRQYNFVGTPFGLTPTSAVLQRTVSTIFHDHPRVVPFQDDITIGSDDYDQHVEDVAKAIDALTRHNLRLRISKCQFFKQSLNVLGHVLSANGIQIDKRKLMAFDVPAPATGKDIERFLGLANYFRDFIPDYATLASPLEQLRHVPLLTDSHWSDRENKAYTAIIQILHNAPMLSLPDFSKEFRVAVDASGTGIGAVLYQLRDSSAADAPKNRNWIVFAARALHSAERRYSATKRELLAIVYALRRFHYYIYGTHFRLFTDHRSLSFILTQRDLNPMLTAWLETILSYTFTVEHRPGVLNILPDALFPALPSIHAVRRRETKPSHVPSHFFNCFYDPSGARAERCNRKRSLARPFRRSGNYGETH